MPDLPIYMDNHATTPCDPRVVEAMLPYFTDKCGNAASINHPFGWEAREAVEHAREQVAAVIGAQTKEIVFTSGATESNNLAIKGLARMSHRKGKHLVTLATEHPSVLDPVRRLAREGWELTALPVQSDGLVDPQSVADALRDDTVLVSVMLANNEIGVIHPVADIAQLCHHRGVPLHCDATQAVGKIPVDAESLRADLISFTAHKMYGPKGIGALCIRRRRPQVRLQPLIDGGGHERNLRSGTLPVPLIVGFAAACRLCTKEMPVESDRLLTLRHRLHDGILNRVDDLRLNGHATQRLPGNLNLSFAAVDGEALMMSMQDVAVSSGSACSSAEPEPSHVLLALGLDEQTARSSLRFGLGRFNTQDEVDFTIDAVARAVERLRAMGSTPVVSG